MSKVKISACAYRHASDVEAMAKVDSEEYDRIANVCVMRATTALDTSAGAYNERHRYHLATIFKAMSGTHRTVRMMIEKSAGASDAVDVLAVTRLQLEALYAVCLMLEGPGYIDCYMREHWHKSYVSFLLRREEFNLLPRWQDYLRDAPGLLALQQREFGITDAQRFTVEHEELGTAMPAGMAEETIPQFPTPGKTIGKITDPIKRKMLERLYPEYVNLCSFAHGLAESTLFKAMFDKRSPFYNWFSESQKKETFEKFFVSGAFSMSMLCILQATAELTVMYPNNMELPEIALMGWGILAKTDLLGKTVWEIRTRQLLRVLG